MQSNPYVYPYTPFADLSKKEIRTTITGSKALSQEELIRIVQRLPKLQVNVEGASPVERLFSFFTHDQVRFGPREYILDLRSFWEERFAYFTNQSLPLQLTLLGFPFKIPVPLKTDRTFPDMGEVLALARLATIAEGIQAIYPPGVIITIFTEGAFGKFSDVSERESRAYCDYVKELITLLGFSSVLKIHELGNIERDVPDFKERNEARIAEFEKFFETRDPAFMKRYAGAYDAIYHVISTRGSSDEVLLDAYNELIPDNALTAEGHAIRTFLRARTHTGVIQYHAYLQVRDDVDYIERIVPHALALSVSPKLYRLGIIPINQTCTRLPHHGVPVYYPEKDRFLIEYLTDVKRSSLTYTAVFLEKDREQKPFYYVAQKGSSPS